MSRPPYRLELPIAGAAYAFTGHLDEATGQVLIDIAVYLDPDGEADGETEREAGPFTVGSLAAPPAHLSGLARALPRVLRDLAQAHRPAGHRPSGSAGTYQQRLAATKARFPRAYQAWNEAEEQRLREAFNADASDPVQHLDALAAAFQRQPSAIRSRLVKLGLLTG